MIVKIDGVQFQYIQSMLRRVFVRCGLAISSDVIDPATLSNISNPTGPRIAAGGIYSTRYPYMQGVILALIHSR